MQTKKIACLALACLALAGPVSAQTAGIDSGFYGAVSTGQIRNTGTSSASGQVFLAGFVGLGYEFNSYFAIEAAKLLNSQVKSAYGNSGIDTTMDGSMITLLGRYPVNETVKLIGSLGQLSYSTSTQIVYQGATVNSWSLNRNVNVIGFGADMLLDRRSAVRLQYIRTGKNENPDGTYDQFEGLLATFNVKF